MINEDTIVTFKQLINEEYFKIREFVLEDIYDAINNLLIYIKYSVNSKHKVNFFTQMLTDALLKLKNDKHTKHEVNEIIQKLKLNYDNQYLAEIGIIDLLENIKKGKNIQRLIDNYVMDIKTTVKYMVRTHENFYNEFSANQKEEKYLLLIDFLKFQEWVIKHKKKVLIIFEGRDGSGKGRNIKKIIEYLNPKHGRVERFSIPTEEEKKNWFKRYIKVLPNEGEIVFFDRSWYNRGIIEPAMHYCTNEQYEEFMDEVNDFENDLMDNDIIIIKIWLNINKLNQLLRFELRKIDPLKYWKFSENDDKILKRWEDLTPYINRVLMETNHSGAEWNIVDANDKKKSTIDVMKTILNLFDYDHKNYKLFKKDTPIIFLDIHGVLITDIQRDKNGNHLCNKGWNHDAIENLNHLTDSTGANIVMISSCKNQYTLPELKKMLKKAGITGDLIDKTIGINKNLREKQIETWFETNGRPKNWIILDDKKYKDYSKYKPHFIQPNPKRGFSHDDLKEAMKILK